MHYEKEIKHFFFQIIQISMSINHYAEIYRITNCRNCFNRFYSFSAGKQSAAISSKSTLNLICKNSKIQAMADHVIEHN